ncbi:MAG TPA: 2-C-methyl-D-erythritol 4-phosphate cytidylyltransferase [Chloroflexota bacterium]|jgi:2-C-methyl-D-erythritol 4-phosphate cytidylyltransferase|nr:2-C-methyl-D-erythritol 4-phosphate cytidylyltransferase [Chloroflexota bacterium]
MMPRPAETLGVIVVAAGVSQRFGGDKLFRRLGDRPVLAWSLDTLDQAPEVEAIVLVLNAANLERGRRLVARRGYGKIRAITLGGTRRQDSVWNGLAILDGVHWVAVHDGARPFITPDMLARGLDVARDVGGAVAAVPVKDTIKIIADANLIERTPDRARVWAAQTPQIFRYDHLVEAYRRCGAIDVTDDAELMERAGMPVAVFPGSYENVKITTVEDFEVARAIARRRRCA